MKSIFKSPYSHEGVKLKPLWKQYYEIIKLYLSLNYMPYEYYCFRFDQADCDDKKILEFLPYSWFLYNVNLDLTPYSWSVLFDNKMLFNSFAKGQGLPVPVDFGIFSRHYGYDLSDRSSLRDETDIETFFRKHRFQKVVIKELAGTQGKNIHFVSEVDYSADPLMLTIGSRKITPAGLKDLMGDKEYLFQEELKNAAFIEGIYPNSLNTFRLITYLTRNNEVRVLGSFLRTGMGHNRVDNWHAGGVLTPVDSEEGSFIDYGYDFNYCLFDKHPDTGFAFRGSKIPHWEELISLVKRGALSFPMMRFIAWDIAFTDRGFVIVEANIREINIFVNQLSDRGMAGILRNDLLEMGFDFPKDKVPPFGIRHVAERARRVMKNTLHLGY